MEPTDDQIREHVREYLLPLVGLGPEHTEHQVEAIALALLGHRELIDAMRCARQLLDRVIERSTELGIN